MGNFGRNCPQRRSLIQLPLQLLDLRADATLAGLGQVSYRLPAHHRSAGQYRWSSARAHLQSADDVMVKASALWQRVPDWRAFLKSGASETDLALTWPHERTRRPLGDAGFLKPLEKRLRLVLRRLQPGPKPQQKRN